VKRALAILAVATSLMAAIGARAGEVDMFSYLVKTLGEPERARKVPDTEIADYVGVVPEALLRFWFEHGRGSYQQGAFWICDPRPLVSVLDEIFRGDAEFDPRQMTVVGYTAFGTMLIWDRAKKQVSVNLLTSAVSSVLESKRIDVNTGKPFSDDFTIGTFITGMKDYDEPLFASALKRLGRLDEGEIYGFVPALQLGGTFEVESLHRMRLAEHASFLTQLQRLKLTRLTSPEPPRYPYGRIEVVRPIGPATR
jgi:hypothetical protein